MSDDSPVETDAEPSPSAEELLGARRIALVGRFGGMNQREAANVMRSYGATVLDLDTKDLDWVIIGADESPLAEAELIGANLLDAAASGTLEILRETELWQRLGWVEVEQSVRQTYTPVMLADLLGVSVRVIRRWHRRGLITPVRTMHRLPYFDFQEVATARRLAGWIASGASPQAIEQRLVDWLQVLPDIRRPLDQLSILVEGKQVLLRSGDGLVDSGGQLHFDFESFEPAPALRIANLAYDSPRDVIPISDAPVNSASNTPPIDPLLAQAYQAEDEGKLETAMDLLHVLMGRDGPRADWHFQLGELLYRTGEISAARERYFAAIEIDPDFVEARCSLGIVLAEQQRLESAIAAFEGALALHDDYPDAHYHLARTIEKLMETSTERHRNDDTDPQSSPPLQERADQHWKRFLELAPESPWAGEAAHRLE